MESGSDVVGERERESRMTPSFGLNKEKWRSCYLLKWGRKTTRGAEGREGRVKMRSCLGQVQFEMLIKYLSEGYQLISLSGPGR